MTGCLIASETPGEMARASQVAVKISAHDVPIYDGLPALIEDGYVTRADTDDEPPP